MTAASERLRVATMVPDGAIERAVEPLVRGRENDELAAGAQVRRRARGLAAVVVDVLEHVDVEDRVEQPVGGHLGQRRRARLDARELAARDRALDPLDQARDRARGTASVRAWARREQGRRAADAGAHLCDVIAQGAVGSDSRSSSSSSVPRRRARARCRRSAQLCCLPTSMVSRTSTKCE